MTINKTNIQWCHLAGRDDGYSANPIRFRNRETGEAVPWACVKVSQGCSHCYAESLALRYGKGSAYTVPNMAKLDSVLDEKVIHEMLTSRKISGAAVFLGDMTDLFGEWVPDDMLDRVFAVMALRPDVTWQLLTKRPERMREYMTAGTNRQAVLGGGSVPTEYGCFKTAFDRVFHQMAGSPQGRRWRVANPSEDFLGSNGLLPNWPLPNVWLGTSVEDQAAADERVVHLLATPAAVRFLSCEPLLEPLRLHLRQAVCACQRSLTNNEGQPSAEPDYDRFPRCPDCGSERPVNGIDWVIVGGESGPHARPCNVEWIRDIVRQCQAADVPVFVKQLGSKPITGDIEPTGRFRTSPDGRRQLELRATLLKLRSSHGSDMAEWPEDLKIRQFPTLGVQFPAISASPDARSAAKRT